MRDWVIIALIVLASLGFGGWLLRRRRPAEGADGRAPDAPQAVEGPSREPTPAAAGRVVGGQAPRGQVATERTPVEHAAGEVPNTKVLPHPDDMPLATLEFDGSIGPVPVRRGEVVIGRHSSDDVRIPDVRVSRHHARLVARSDGGFEIHNLTSVRSEPNPMLVNGVSREHARIDDGDVITLGGVSFTFRQAAA